jgi:hypothetical protein
MHLTQPIARAFESLPNDIPPLLWASPELPLLDEAIDYAARVSQGTVCEFLAAPAAASADDAPHIDMAIEFFIPPASLTKFIGELDRAMMRRSLTYSGARRQAIAAPIRVTALSPSAFHQWRKAWRIDPQAQRAQRWSADRSLLDELLLYARSGWRELTA